MDAMMALENLCVSYGSTPVLENITTAFPRNKITAVMGPSGCGKSTLLRCLNGMISEVKDARVSGTVLLDGKDIKDMDSEQLCKRAGLVFQTPTPFPFSIEKNMTYALKYYGMRDAAKMREIAMQKLQVTGLYDEVKDDLGKSALKLSGGQQQRLCIARALTAEPDVLLLDEPCSALDIQSTLQIEAMLKDCKKDYTIIMVTHNIAQAKRIADKVVFLFKNRLLEEGDAKEFFENPVKEETRAFLEGFYS